MESKQRCEAAQLVKVYSGGVIKIKSQGAERDTKGTGQGSVGVPPRASPHPTYPETGSGR